MPTQPIEHTVQGYTYQRPKKAQGDVEFALGPEGSKTRQDAVPESGAGVRAYLCALLSEAVPGDDNRLSFTDVGDYAGMVQSEWNRAVDSDLRALGVDTGQPFRLLCDPSGSVSVIGEHPDKEMINAYFTANPDRGRELGQALQYGRLDAAARNRLSPAEQEQTLQTEAMAWWYASNMDTSTLFSGGGMVFGAGRTPYRSVDIRV